MEKQLYAIKSDLEYAVQDTISNLDYFTWKVKEGVMNLNYSLKKVKEDFKEEAYNVGKSFLGNFNIELPTYANYNALRKRKKYLDSLDKLENAYLNCRKTNSKKVEEVFN